LDKTSRALKQSREQLTHDMQKAEKQLRHEVRRKVRVQMSSRTLSNPCTQVRAGSFLSRNGFFLLCVVLAQIFLAFMMYRYDPCPFRFPSHLICWKCIGPTGKETFLNKLL